MLTDVYENFRNMCLKIYQLNLAKFLSALRLAWKAALKKAKINLDLLTDIDMLLWQKKEKEYATLFSDMQKEITNTWKIMIKIKNSHIFKIGM